MLEVKPKSDVLLEVVQSLQKRRKALKYKVDSLACERVVERSDDGDLEKLEVRFKNKNGPLSTTLTFHIWEDRWAWIDARAGGKMGWKWEWSGEGRMSGRDIGKQVLTHLEKSLSVMWDEDADISQALESLWVKILAKGPVANF